MGADSFQEPSSSSSQFNSLSFLMQSLLGKMATATLVKVMAVTNAGGVIPVGFVDILPLVNQIDGSWAAEPHVTIYKCPYFRLQGGVNAIILDPQVGDIGIAVFADHDISSVTANKAQANPGSRRRFDMSDGLYIGGMLNGSPTQYVQFSTAGITIHSPTLITLSAPDIQLNAATVEVAATGSMTITTPTLTINGNVATTGTLTNNSTNVSSTHVHGGVTPGGASTAGPH